MTDTANLEDGFYWVRIGMRWFVAEHFHVGLWIIPGTTREFASDDFFEIDPRPIKREDVK